MFKGLKKLFDPSLKELSRCEKLADKVIALALAILSFSLF